MSPAIEKIWEMGLTRSDVLKSKYSNGVGGAPEPLTDYMDVSIVCWFDVFPDSSTVPQSVY